MPLPGPFPSWYLPRAALASSRLVSPAKGGEFVFGSGCSGLPVLQEKLRHVPKCMHALLWHTQHVGAGSPPWT